MMQEITEIFGDSFTWDSMYEVLESQHFILEDAVEVLTARLTNSHLQSEGIKNTNKLDAKKPFSYIKSPMDPLPLILPPPPQGNKNKVSDLSSCLAIQSTPLS